jgi:hypothetical protein
MQSTRTRKAKINQIETPLEWGANQIPNKSNNPPYIILPQNIIISKHTRSFDM